MKNCKECVHLDIYVKSDKPDTKILTCSGDGWDNSDDDGILLIPEVSEFDANSCLLYKRRVWEVTRNYKNP